MSYVTQGRLGMYQTLVDPCFLFGDNYHYLDLCVSADKASGQGEVELAM
jgi:hypothetical protein